jgi:hypothetical protein
MRFRDAKNPTVPLHSQQDHSSRQALEEKVAVSVRLS